MKQKIIAIAMLGSALAAVGTSESARAQIGKNYVGPAVSIGGGTTAIGVQSKFGVNENLSLRPFIYFPSGGTVFGSGLTYDFNTIANPSSRVQITPFVGGAVNIASGGGSNTTVVSFLGGADFTISDNVDLTASLDVPLTSGYSTSVQLGAGFRF